MKAVRIPQMLTSEGTTFICLFVESFLLSLSIFPIYILIATTEAVVIIFIGSSFILLSLFP